MEPYQAQSLPLDHIDYKRLFSYIGDANAELARYDGLLHGIVNPVILLSPLTTQEAVLSSKIEGTQATLDEVLEHEAGLAMDEDKNRDIQEIINYRKALMVAKDVLTERPISLYLIREMHKILLDSVRGKDKDPGEFRKDQNWIGRAGCSIEDATFVPPSPFQLQNYIEQWERYIQGSDIDVLLQLAVVHAQFELIHPFKDGNGRIGRLLIPLFLYQKKKLASPMFYLSAYLERNRDNYYAFLQGIAKNNDWNSWIEFFFQAVSFQSKENSQKVRQMMKLYEIMKDRIVELTHSQYSIRILDAIFDRPIFQTSDFVKRAEIPKQTAMPLIRLIRDKGYLKTIREASGRQSAILVFPELLAIAEGKQFF